MSDNDESHVEPVAELDTQLLPKAITNYIQGAFALNDNTYVAN